MSECDENVSFDILTRAECFMQLKYVTYIQNKYVDMLLLSMLPISCCLAGYKSGTAYMRRLKGLEM